MAEAVAQARAFVCIENGFYAGLEWPLDRASTVIGRGRQADLLLFEATISRAHALLAYRADQLFLQDLSSTNGTLVNGKAEQQIDLADGDRLQMGRLELRIRIGEESGAEPSRELAHG
jgi:pSer/pThr/pTyr-binding forkhead associated (FHA) protein